MFRVFCFAAILLGVVHAPAQVVIAHRGASGYLPEHTLEAYAMAYGQGADYIEPDLVRTKDGEFICLHDIHLEATTDVEEVFPNRTREDGRWYAADFTLDEIRRLRVHERLPNRFPIGTSSFRVPTFREMIELIQGLNKTTGRKVGIYPELKAPSFHAKEELAMEEAFLDLVRGYGYTEESSPIFVQCFEAEALQTLRELGSRLQHVYLVGGGPGARQIQEEAGLKSIAAYADGIGPSKNLIEQNPQIVKMAQAAGLVVHPYTLRADDLPSKYRDPEAEIEAFFDTYGVDGIFTDFPDQAVKWLSERAGE